MTKETLIATLKWSVIGAALAGVYGIVHDQITFTISPEYFTRLSFLQFNYADLGLGDRMLVGEIGFLATWWVGLFTGWFLGRRFVSKPMSEGTVRQIKFGFVLIFASAVAFGVCAFVYGLLIDHHAVLREWSYILRAYNVKDGLAFIQVAYIHNASYAGALFGIVCTFIFVRRISTKELEEPTG